MIRKLIAKIGSKAIGGMITKYLKKTDIKFSIGKIKVIVPIEINGAPTNFGEEKINQIVNDIINTHIEPKIKNIIDLQAEINIA